MQEDKIDDHKAYDIIVCGLGPVGLLTCNTLGLRGYRVLGVDRFEKALVSREPFIWMKKLCA